MKLQAKVFKEAGSSTNWPSDQPINKTNGI